MKPIFIQLTKSNGEPILLNVAHIIEVNPGFVNNPGHYPSNSRVLCIGSEKSTPLKETYDEVKEKINSELMHWKNL